MSGSPPYALAAWQIGLLVTYGLLVVNFVLLIRNIRRERRARERDYLMRLTLREGPSDSQVEGHVELLKDNPTRARVLLVIASQSIAAAGAELESALSEEAMEAKRHAP